MDGSRGLHYLLIALVWAVVCLPNLGGPSLWDIDEGNNAEAAREMLISGNWIVPHFNYGLREDKPALLYWCQVLCYQALGVNEFAARLPSALAVLLLSLVVYELGRGMFRASTGLLAALGTPTSLLLWAAGHFANPDALLTLSLALAFAWFWAWDRGWTWAALPMGLSIGVGVLAKGPVALVLPVLVTWLYLFWQGRWRTVFRSSLVLGFSSWALVALPWYIWVTLDTHGAWFKGFWFRHNQGRFLTAMETHGGPIVYYLPVLLIGLAPWSLFLVHAIGNAIRRGCERAVPGEAETDLRHRDALRYLLVWAGVYVAFFSLSATKLPNYVLPAYPALLLLIAERLDRWRQGESWPRWVEPAAQIACGLSAVVLVLAAPLGGRLYPGVEWLAALALFPLATLGLLLWKQREGDRPGLVTGLAVLTVLWTACLAIGPMQALEAHKAAKPLVAELPPDHLQRDIRLVTHAYFQPSLVFYSRRLVEKLDRLDEVALALQSPQPVYAFLPRDRWSELQRQNPALAHEVASRRDFYRRQEVVLITNESGDARAVVRKGPVGPQADFTSLRPIE